MGVVVDDGVGVGRRDVVTRGKSRELDSIIKILSRELDISIDTESEDICALVGATVGSGVGRRENMLDESSGDDCEGAVVESCVDSCEGVKVGSCVDTCEGVTSIVDN